MAKTFKLHERAPYRPNRCVVTKVVGSPENPLIDLDTQIDYYGMVYLSYNVFVAIADQLGFMIPEQANLLRAENAKLKKRLDRIPAVTERLVNDIRDISIAATADLLSDATPVVLVNDKSNKQIDARVDNNDSGGNDTAEQDSKPVVSEGPAVVSAGNGSKRTNKPAPRTSSSSN